MPSFKNTENYWQEMANHSSQGLEAADSDYF